MEQQMEPSSSTSAAPKKSNRRSAPGRPARMSILPRAPRQQAGWEFPMSREEKKHRVMYLFEQELAEAKQSGAENLEALINENEALHAQLQAQLQANDQLAEEPFELAEEDLDRIDGVRLAPRRSSSSDGSTSATEEEELGDPAVPCKSSGRLLLPLILALLVLAVAAVLGVMRRAQEPNEEPGHLVSVTMVAAATAGPPNTTDAARRLREHGLARLAVSDCWKAEWYFSSAMKLLDEQSELGGNLSMSAEMEGHRLSLLADRGFALVCAQQYRQGAPLLDQYVTVHGANRSAAHLLNALGFAHFRLKDYERAIEGFAAGTKIDPLNPIIWNNLGAAMMVFGDLVAADDALYRAVENSEPKEDEEHFQVEQYHRLMFMNNVKNLDARNRGEASTLPVIEIWWGGEKPPKSPELGAAGTGKRLM